MFKVFTVAKHFQPAIILFDEVEHFFGKKNLKKKKNYAGKCAKFKKEIINHVNKHLTPEDKVLLIGITSNPQYVNVGDVKKMFYKKFYFPFPDYSSRRIIFQEIIKKYLKKYYNKKIDNFKKHDEIFISETFPFSTLAFYTEGYSIGSFVKLLKEVLTAPRIEILDIKPLSLEELAEPLSKLSYCSLEEYKVLKEFTQTITGIKERLEKKVILDKEKLKNKKK